MRAQFLSNNPQSLGNSGNTLLADTAFDIQYLPRMDSIGEQTVITMQAFTDEQNQQFWSRIIGGISGPYYEEEQEPVYIAVAARLLGASTICKV